MKFMRTISVSVALALALPALSACISTNVSERDFAEPLPKHIDPAKRAQAVAEMRQKGAAAGNAPPSAFVNDNPALEPKSAAEVTALKNELSAEVQNQNARLSDAELEAQKREMEELRREAASHYQNAVNSIEN